MSSMTEVVREWEATTSRRTGLITADGVNTTTGREKR